MCTAGNVLFERQPVAIEGDDAIGIADRQMYTVYYNYI